jgi:SNF2 family DNA or RNA helicase
MTDKLPVIIDNRRDNTVLNALKRLLLSTNKLDIATGYFEIGSLLLLEDVWQHVEKIRILAGDETSKRTKDEILKALLNISNESIEKQKEEDDSLKGLPAIRNAISKNRIAIRIYNQAKFHAKAYLMEASSPSPVDFALVGSSNFTKPGLTQNVELNLFSTDQVHIENLRKWMQELWEISLDVSGDLLKVIEPHLKDYDPFTVYCKALYEFFSGREKTQDEWEITDSVIYPILSQYQRDGYHRALQIAETWKGALICDGVGLGKTFIALMLIERLLHEDKRILLIVPKSAEQSVWRANIKRFLEPHYSIELEERLRIERHTSFGKPGIIPPHKLQYYKKRSDVVIIDEAHHFRNHRANRGRLFKSIATGKTLYMLTATPINNSLDDLYHLINYFAQDNQDHFAPIRIHNLRRHFLDVEKKIIQEKPEEDLANAIEEKDLLRTDDLLKNVLIQRSRSYVKKSEGDDTANAPLFPERQKPRVIKYSLKSVYENIYNELSEAFHKKTPFLSLAIYNTAAYHKNPDKSTKEYQKLLIGLIRTLLLKRLESSFKAFEASVEDLLEKMAQFLKHHNKGLFEDWTNSNKRWWNLVQKHINERLEQDEKETEEEEENQIPDFFSDFEPDEHDMDKLLEHIKEDMDQLANFLSKIYRRFYIKGKEGEVVDPRKDPKLQALIETLREDKLLIDEKVVIFSEFRGTARYLKDQLVNAGFKKVEQVDSGRNVTNREMIIKRFSPYYNCITDTANLENNIELDLCLKNPIDILVSTDVLSEGLNLQDASRIINYDLHWNPVRLIQRIGRVDRRLDYHLETLINRPEESKNKVYFWNFLPPAELENLLNLARNLDGKIRRINKTLGIEGALLRPDDPDMALKVFNERYEGKESIEELMHLERQRIESEEHELWENLPNLPKRLFSGKKAGSGFGPIMNRKGEELYHFDPPQKKGIFACYRMPAIIDEPEENLICFIEKTEKKPITLLGEVRWYFWDMETGEVEEDLANCWSVARCGKETTRKINKGVSNLSEPRKAIEKYIKNSFLKEVQAPIGAKATLLAWMEIS